VLSERSDCEKVTPENPRQPTNKLRNPDIPNRPSSQLRTVAKGSLLTFGGTIVGRGLSFLIRVIVTRVFGAKYFGVLVIGTMVSEFTRTFASMGLPRGGMRFVSVAIGSNKLDRLPGIFGTAILIPVFFSLPLSVIIFYLSEIISNSWFKTAELAPVLRLLALSIPFATIVRVGLELSKGFSTTKYSVLVENFFMPLVIVIFFFLFYFLDAAFNSIIYAIIVSTVLSAIFILFLLQKQLQEVMGPSWNNLAFLKRCFITRESREVVTYSIPLFLTGFAVIAMNSTDIFMLGLFLDAAYVGVYSAAATFAIFFSSLFVISLNSIFAPLIATQYGQSATDKIRYLYITATRWMFYSSLPLVVSVMIAREQIMLIFGKDFIIDGPVVLFVLLIGHMVNCLTGGVGQILSMTGHQKKELSINVIVIMLNVGLNLLLIPKFGIIGAAIATSSSQITVNVLRVFIVYKIVKVQPFTIKLLKLLFIGVGVVSLSFVIKIYPPIRNYDLVFAVLSIFMMIAAIFILKLEKEDKELLKTLPIIRFYY